MARRRGGRDVEARPAALISAWPRHKQGLAGTFTRNERRWLRQEMTMALRETISEALKTALKAQDKPRVATLRLVNAAIQSRDIENRGASKPAAGDDEVLQLLAKMVKQREESATAFEAGKRPELAAQERSEIEIIRDFMPRQMDQGEMEAAIKATILETGAAGIKDMGKVMAALRAAHAGRMDFGKASGVIKALLG